MPGSIDCRSPRRHLHVHSETAPSLIASFVKSTVRDLILSEHTLMILKPSKSCLYGGATTLLIRVTMEVDRVDTVSHL